MKLVLIKELKCYVLNDKFRKVWPWVQSKLTIIPELPISWIFYLQEEKMDTTEQTDKELQSKHPVSEQASHCVKLLKKYLRCF